MTEISHQREIDQFKHDLVRASWVIETILEVEREYQGTVPDEWIQGVTKGLFEHQPKSLSNLDDGAQALRALMGVTASASFGPDGPKFDINRKGAKKLANAPLANDEPT